MIDILKRICIGTTFILATILNQHNVWLGLIGFFLAYAVLDWYIRDVKKSNKK